MAEAKPTELGRKLQSLDRRTAESMLPYQESVAVQAIDLFAKLGDQPPLRFLCAALVAGGFVRRDGRMARAGARMLAAHTLATVGKNIAKHRIDRTRPREVGKKDGDHRISPGRSRSKAETSFPSGHSAGAAAVAAAFAREYPEHAVAAHGTAAAIALAQIPRCAHYPTDIGAGLAIGIAAERVADAAIRLAEGGQTS